MMRRGCSPSVHLRHAMDSPIAESSHLIASCVRHLFANGDFLPTRQGTRCPGAPIPLTVQDQQRARIGNGRSRRARAEWRKSRLYVRMCPIYDA
jgi:hypothetical protein